jgi:thiamine-phosphate pyrophosphorylase
MTKSIPSLKEKRDLSGMVDRLIDANLNRLKEGLRVVEDICRYIHNDKALTSSLKIIRHSLQSTYTITRVFCRDTQSDIQKTSIPSEQLRRDITDIVIANFSRAEESSRVLEEIFKLTDIEESEKFKAVRYKIYALEKQYLIDYLLPSESPQ